MWWNDIKSLKRELEGVRGSLIRIEVMMREVRCNSRDDHIQCALKEIKDSIEDTFHSDDEYNSINRIHDKLNTLVSDEDRQRTVLLAEKTLDKFEDYMKNIDKLNSMINEFKGCVSMARSALEGRRQLCEQENKGEVLTNILLEIYKIDAIYRAVCEKTEKKPVKPRKKVKKESPAS